MKQCIILSPGALTWEVYLPGIDQVRMIQPGPRNNRGLCCRTFYVAFIPFYGRLVCLSLADISTLFILPEGKGESFSQ
jgi:hypothetical protein